MWVKGGKGGRDSTLESVMTVEVIVEVGHSVYETLM